MVGILKEIIKKGHLRSEALLHPSERIKDQLKRLLLEDRLCVDSRTRLFNLFSEGEEDFLITVKGPDSSALLSTVLTFDNQLRFPGLRVTEPPCRRCPRHDPHVLGAQ